MLLFTWPSSKDAIGLLRMVDFISPMILQMQKLRCKTLLQASVVPLGHEPGIKFALNRPVGLEE